MGICRKPAITEAGTCGNCGEALAKSTIRKSGWEHVSTAVRTPRGCRNCGEDIRGLYGSDRAAHREGWCTSL